MLERRECVIYSSPPLFGVSAKQNTLLQRAALAPNPRVLLGHVRRTSYKHVPEGDIQTKSSPAQHEPARPPIQRCSTAPPLRCSRISLPPLTAPGGAFPAAFKNQTASLASGLALAAHQRARPRGFLGKDPSGAVLLAIKEASKVGRFFSSCSLLTLV